MSCMGCVLFVVVAGVTYRLHLIIVSGGGGDCVSCLAFFLYAALGILSPPYCPPFCLKNPEKTPHVPVRLFNCALSIMHSNLI